MPDDLNSTDLTQEEIVRERKKRIFSLKTLLFFIISIALVAFLITRIDLGSSLEKIKKASLPLLGGACLIYFLSNFFKSLRLYFLLSGFPVSLPRLYVITSFHNFFNQILPARTGELTLIYYLKKIGGAGMSKGLHLLVIIRVFDFVTISALFVCSFMVYFGGQSSLPFLLMGFFFFCFSLVVLFNLRRVAIFGHRVFSAFVRKTGLSDKGLIKKIMGRIDSVVEEFSAFETTRHLPGLVFSSILIWLTLYSMFYVCIIAFGISIDYLAAVIGSTGGVLTNVLPINSVGSFGTLEAGWAGGFVLMGLDKHDAILSGFGYHFVSLFASGFIAALCGIFYSLFIKTREGDF